jgi:hypothetical protein
MAGQLISISLTVDQHDGGDYFWVLLESFDNSMEFEPLMEAATGFATYGDALQAGYVVLKGLSDDLSVRPPGGGRRSACPRDGRNWKTPTDKVADFP